MAVACNPRSRRIAPLHFSLRSTTAPDCRSENDELGRILGLIREVHGNKGIYVYDRGGDNIELFRCLTGNGLRFTVRLKRRDLVSRESTWDSDWG